MSAERVLSGVIESALATVTGLNRVEPGAAVRATSPYAEIGPVEARDWGTKDAAGREIRLTVTVRDAADRAARVHALSDAAAAAVTAIDRDVPGWRIVSLTFLRSRVASEKAGTWVATTEWRARMLAT